MTEVENVDEIHKRLGEIEEQIDALEHEKSRLLLDLRESGK